jgi:V8-like Glu-specific endopeptidase
MLEKVSTAQFNTTSSADQDDPLTPDQLLDYENIRASDSMPGYLLESMSERRVHISSADEAADVALEDLARALATTASFRLPANTFLGQLGRDGRTQVSVPAAPESNNAVVRPFRPTWRDYVYHPKMAPISSNIVVKGRDADRIRAHKVFPPENRTAFRPEGYPWTCIGRIEVFQNGVGGRFGTATLIGRRIVLTSGHLMPRDGSPGRWGIRFIPGCFDGRSTVGLASWTEAYRALIITVADDTQDRDIAILKLYDPLGEALGWMGMKTYNDDWEDRGMWTLVGYPDITSAMRPTRQAGIPVIDDDPSGDFTEIEHRGDASDGNSGGPLFAQFPDGPYLVGVHSGYEYRMAGPFVAEDNNVASGGRGMVNLANALEAEWP